MRILIALFIFPILCHGATFSYQTTDRDIVTTINNCEISTTWTDIESNHTTTVNADFREATLYISPKDDMPYIYEIKEQCTTENKDSCKTYSTLHKIIQKSELIAFCNDRYPNCATYSYSDTDTFRYYESLSVEHFLESNEKHNSNKQALLDFLFKHTQLCTEKDDDYKHEYQIDILKVERALQVTTQDQTVKFKTAHINNSGFAGQRLVCGITYDDTHVLTHPFTKDLIVFKPKAEGSEDMNQLWDKHCENQLTSEEALLKKVEQRLLEIKPNQKIVEHHLYGQQELNAFCGVIEDQSSFKLLNVYYDFSNKPVIEDAHRNFQKIWDKHCFKNNPDKTNTQ